jgi:hypothetical protein
MVKKHFEKSLENPRMPFKFALHEDFEVEINNKLSKIISYLQIKECVIIYYIFFDLQSHCRQHLAYRFTFQDRIYRGKFNSSE